MKIGLKFFKTDGTIGKYFYKSNASYYQVWLMKRWDREILCQAKRFSKYVPNQFYFIEDKNPLTYPSWFPFKQDEWFNK